MSMMDTVYGTKKYFQSLSGSSDIYRTSTSRAMVNDYSSYQNTLGRRSVIGPYTHMNKLPSYSTDMSLSSHYGGYNNTWGVWRDTRNISPSIYSTKSRQSARSFSIILTTAAFIVVLAVLSIAGLAFYFSTIKASLEDNEMAFEGSFRVVKGDIFTTGLKHNHTSIFRQKADFYKRFLERSLLDHGLHPTKSEIVNFGDGPLIKVHFRVLLDMRQLPQNIHSMEEHIRESIFLETESIKSLYKSLKLEPDTVEVKRILDEAFLKSATFIRDSGPAASQTHFEERLNKNSGMIEKTLGKILTTHRPKYKPIDNEPDVDVENAPVIQGSFEGSFEITKTDADITQKRTSPSKASSVTASPMRVKTKKTTIEKVKLPVKSHETTAIPPTTTTTKITTTTTTKVSTSLPPITEVILEKENKKILPVKESQITELPVNQVTTELEKILTTTPVPISTHMNDKASPISNVNLHSEQIPVMSTDKINYANLPNPPKLDSNLFTSVPILDTEPWRPIRPPGHTSMETIPNFQTHLHGNLKTTFNNPTRPEFEAIEAGLLPRNKFKFSEQVTTNPNEMILYHSFTNPVFMPGTAGIEKLGSSDVKPHPLPVPLIDDVVKPNEKPLQPNDVQMLDIRQRNNANSDAVFEHLGGGVIVKNPKPEIEVSTKPSNVLLNHDEKESMEVGEQKINMTLDDEKIDSETENAMEIVEVDTGGNPLKDDKHVIPVKKVPVNNKDSNSAGLPVTPDISDGIGDLLHDLLDMSLNRANDTHIAETENLQVESRIEEDNIGRPNFLNIREHILSKNKPQGTIISSLDEQIESGTTAPSSNSKKVDKITTDMTDKGDDTESLLKITSTSAPASEQSQQKKHKRPTSTPTPTTNFFPITPSTTLPVRTTTMHMIKINNSSATKVMKRPTPKPVISTQTTIDQSMLFPSHSKWEYVNGSSNGYTSSTAHMKKVFNDTLQAWVVESIEKPDDFQIKVMQIKKNNTEEEIQNISHIFDTLASKLGIAPNIPTKTPPFVAFSSNKLKQSLSATRRPRPNVAPSLSPTTISTVPSTTIPTSTETPTIPTGFNSVPNNFADITTTLPAIIGQQFSTYTDDDSFHISPEVIFGEAEVEVVDPTKYEEMLSSQATSSTTSSTTTTTRSPPSLVTLLPVRSNSGIRTIKPLSVNGGGGGSGNDNDGESRRFGSHSSYGEAIVKTGIQVTT